MRNVLFILIGVILLAGLIGPASAREKDKAERQIYRAWTEEEFPQAGAPGAKRYMSAQVDTYCIAWYDFEAMDWQGWTVVDNSAQPDTFSHVDDFAGLGGGSFGGLIALEGAQSMWCGGRPGTGEYMCSWIRAPGYGNSWNQMLVSDAFSFTGMLTFSYHGYFDSEDDYDFTYVEYDAGEGYWIELAAYDGRQDTIATHDLLLAQARTKLRFHFQSDGYWSDQDGLWNTDGAFIVDSLVVRDVTGTINYEDFEGAGFGDKSAGIWHGSVIEPYGNYAGLANSLADKDPCGDNFATQVVFFIGSPYPSSSYPGLFDTPFCAGPGGITAPCQDEYVVSPVIDLTKYSSSCDENQDTDIPDVSTLGGAVLRFTVYRDIPLQNLVLYYWGVRGIDDAGCPSVWDSRGYVYYGPDMDYIFQEQDIGDLITEDKIQIRVGCRDKCDDWYLNYGNCAAHTPSPYIDNVRFYRYETVGPQWSSRNLQMFQDNFPEDEFDIESYVRADAAWEWNGDNFEEPILPIDQIYVTCTSPLAGGLAVDPDGLAKVYMHVRCTYIGDPVSPKPALFGPSLEGTYGHYISDDGVWTILQCDSLEWEGGTGTVPDNYMWDLNDSLFTRGYLIEYYFKAEDLDGYTSTHPARAETEDQFFEFTCLPTLASDILYVDDFHGRGTLEGTVENYLNQSFQAVLPPENQPDRYDVNNPSSLVNNGPGSRAKNFHMTTAYRKVIWDSGNLENGTICDGTEDSDKSEDCQLLVDWMNLSEHDVGLWIMGDDIAYDLSGLTSTIALDLISNWCGVTLEHNCYYDLTGGRVSGGVVTPLVKTVNNPYPNPMHTDSLYADAGCTIINAFDVLGNTQTSEYALQYPDFQEQQYYAGIQHETTNAAAFAVKTMWFGFSFMYMRDASITPGVAIVRNRITQAVINWMGNTTNDNITEIDELPRAYKLAQNFPNPFNPQTTIAFDMREKAHVTIRIYNVAGQLVRTLVDGVRDAGSHRVPWDGRNNDGVGVTSGVYFYKMETQHFSATRKMVMLR